MRDIQMKLQCQVDVVNRQHCNLNIRSNGRYLKSTIALAKDPKCKNDEKLEYFILLFTTTNKTGTKYRVTAIKQVFCKCVNNGLTTLRFEEPPVDLCIKSEVTQLKCFLKLLRSCISGDCKDLKLSVSSIGITSIENAPTKMIIQDRSQFPDKGLPRTLESLQIIGLKIHNFRRDILLLRNLVKLDLSDNEIEKIPPEFGRMPNLTELILANNQLGNKPEIDWRWLFGPQITTKLRLLNLKGNNLTHLPKALWKLQKLVTLNVENNKLTNLPSTLGRVSSLRYLNIAENEIEFLPCSLMHCRLEYINISQNKFQLRTGQITCKVNSHWDTYVGSLVHLASKVVLKKKIFYAPNIIPRTLVDFLDDANMCICGKPVVNTASSFHEFDLKTYFQVVVFDSFRNSSVEFECFFCSPSCHIFHSF